MNKIASLLTVTILLFACSEDNEPQTELNPPSIEILAPNANSTFDIEDEIIFQANVSDMEDTGSQLEISISSDIQGNLTTNIPIINNSISYVTSNLIEGIHLITISVTDSDNMQSSDEVNINVSDIPETIILNPITLQNGELLLNWTVSNESEFESYSIMRSENEQGSYEVIETISDINITNYTDVSIEFAINYFYKISTNLLNLNDVPTSNIESGIFETDNIDLGTNIERLKIDPIRPYIYALDKDNGNLLFINKQTLQLESSLSIGNSPTDMDISEDNSKLYVALFNTDKIAVVDLNTQQKMNDLTIDITAGSEFETPFRLVCIGNDKLVVTSYDQWCNIALINANDGEILWIGFSFYKPNLLTPPDKMSVLVSETRSTGSTTYRYNLESNGLLSPTNVDNTGDHDWWHPQYGADYTAMSGNGEYIFYCGKKFTFDNLSQVLGSFQDKIYGSNEDGSIVIGGEHIWDANNFSISETLPFINTGKMVFDNSTNIVYIFYENTNKLYYFNID
jgi:DNA-binding beta-propeller fold protein YncE